MKTRVLFLSVVVICAVVAAALFFAKAFCDDNEDYSFFDALYVDVHAGYYYQLLKDVLPQIGVIYEHAPKLNSLAPIIAYLAQKEKSPPPLNSFPVI